MSDGSPSITVCNKASASGVATIDLSSVLDSDLNEQQWREAEADYCSRLLDGQAEAMSLREVFDAFGRLVCLNRCWGQLRHAAKQASAPRASGPNAAEHTPDGSAPPVPAVIDAAVLRQQLLQALQRPAFNDCELLGWLGRVVPWNEAAARRLERLRAAPAVDADTKKHHGAQGAQQAKQGQPTGPPQQQQHFLQTLPKLQTRDLCRAGDITAATAIEKATQPPGPDTPAAMDGTWVSQQPTHMAPDAAIAACWDGTAAPAAGAAPMTGRAVAAPLLSPPPPAAAGNASVAGIAGTGGGAGPGDTLAQQQHSYGRRRSNSPRSSTSSGSFSSRSYSSRSYTTRSRSTSRSRSRSRSWPRSGRSRSRSYSRSRSRSYSRSRSRSYSRPRSNSPSSSSSGSDSGSPSTSSSSGSRRQRQSRGMVPHTRSPAPSEGKLGERAAAHAQSQTATGKGTGDGEGGAEGAGGAAPAADALPAAAPAAALRQEVIAKGFAATVDTALEREQPLPAAPPQGLGLQERAGRAPNECSRDPCAAARMLPGGMTIAAAQSAAAAARPVVAAAAAAPAIAGDSARQTAAVEVAAAEVPPQTRALSGAGGQAQLSRQSSELSEGELPRSDTAYHASGQPAEDNTTASTRPAKGPPPHDRRPSSRHHHSPADRGRGRSPARSRDRSPARGRDRSRSRSNRHRSRSLSRYPQWRSRSWTPPRGVARREAQSEQLAWARQLHKWLLRQPGHTATILQARSAGLGVPGRVLDVTRRKPHLFWGDHSQLWDLRRHKQNFWLSELRVVLPDGAGTGGTEPAAGSQQPAGGGETSAPGSEQERAQLEARYVRELYAFLLMHPEGIAVRDLFSYNMEVPPGILRGRKITTPLKYYQSMGILRINNPPPGTPEPLTLWAVPGRHAEAAVEEVRDRLAVQGRRRHSAAAAATVVRTVGS